MGFFSSEIEQINVNNGVQISSKKMGSAKLRLSNLQGLYQGCWLYINQRYFTFVKFIYYSFIFLTS